MRSATVLYKDQAAGTLTQLDDGSFEFAYLDQWLSDRSKPAISLTLPKKQEVYRSDLFSAAHRQQRRIQFVIGLHRSG